MEGSARMFLPAFTSELFFSFSYDPTVEIAFYFYFFRFIGHTNVPLAFSPDF